MTLKYITKPYQNAKSIVNYLRRYHSRSFQNTSPLKDLSNNLLGSFEREGKGREENKGEGKRGERKENFQSCLGVEVRGMEENEGENINLIRSLRGKGREIVYFLSKSF